MSATRRTKPTDEEQEVLQEAKKFYGRSWRQEIQTAWMNGNYQGFPNAHMLQRMRNDPDRGWYPATVKLPKV